MARMDPVKWKEHRGVLEELNSMRVSDAQGKVTDILRFIMDYIKPRDPPDLPPLTPEMGVKIQTLMELFHKQFMIFAEFMNDSEGKVPTKRYAEFILYALGKDLEAM